MAVSIHFTGTPKPKCMPPVIRSAISQLRSLKRLTEQQLVIHFSAQTLLNLGENKEGQKTTHMLTKISILIFAIVQNLRQTTSNY